MERPVSEQLQSLKDRIQKFRDMLSQPDSYNVPKDNEDLLLFASKQNPYYPPFVPKKTKIAERHPSKKYGFHQFDDQFSDDSSDDFHKRKKQNKHKTHNSKGSFNAVRHNQANYSHNSSIYDKQKRNISYNNSKEKPEIPKYNDQSNYELPKKPLLFVKPEPNELKYRKSYKYISSDDSTDYEDYIPKKGKKYIETSSSSADSSSDSEEISPTYNKYQKSVKNSKYNISSNDSEQSESDSYDCEVILKPERSIEKSKIKNNMNVIDSESNSSDSNDNSYTESSSDSSDDDYKLKELLRKAEQIQTSFSRISSQKPSNPSAQSVQKAPAPTQSTQSEIRDDDVSISYVDAEVSTTSESLNRTTTPRRTVKSPIRFDGGVNDLLSRVMLGGDSISEDSDPPTPKPTKSSKPIQQQALNSESESEYEVSPSRSFDFEAFKARLHVSDNDTADAGSSNSLIMSGSSNEDGSPTSSDDVVNDGSEASDGSSPYEVDQNSLQKEQDKDAQFLQEVQRLLRNDPTLSDSDDEVSLNFGDLGSASDSSDTL